MKCLRKKRRRRRRRRKRINLNIKYSRGKNSEPRLFFEKVQIAKTEFCVIHSQLSFPIII